jgi:hypothetical protein
VGSDRRPNLKLTGATSRSPLYPIAWFPGEGHRQQDGPDTYLPDTYLQGCRARLFVGGRSGERHFRKRDDGPKVIYEGDE